MRRLAIVLVLLMAAPAAAAGPALPLGHAGRWITDARGRVVVLHGINMVYKRPPYAPDATGFGADDAAFLAREGLNTVRVGLIYKAVEPRPGHYDDRYITRIKRTVDQLGRRGVVSLLDFHQDLFNERFQGEGWPDWAVQDDGLPAQPQQGFPANYLVMPALQRAFDHFWANDPGPGGVGLQDRYAAAWRHVAARFRGDRAVLGYDLLNEPWPGTAWQQCANTAGCPAFDAQLTAFARRVIKAIRKADRRPIAFAEPAVLFNFGAGTSLGDLGDPNSGFSFHDYCLTEAQSGPSGCNAQDDLDFQHADARGKQFGEALLETEFGATDDVPYLTAQLARSDRFMIGWQEWHYCGCRDPTTSGPGDKQAIVLDPKKPPAGRNLKKVTLDLLVRPYPRLVSGTPQSWSFDPDTRLFRAAWTTARVRGHGRFAAGAVSEIAVSRRLYPHGYRVSVRGGRVTSARGARILTVAAARKAKTVEVTVRPV